MSNQRRGPWSQQEDRLLMHLVETQGALNWVKISSMLESRTPKQCRERYHQNLKPSLNHEPISTEEGALIETLVHTLGKRWAEIARRLHNRSDNAVKNWWNGSMNRRKRLVKRRAPVYDDPIEASHHSYHRAPAPLRLPPVSYSPYAAISPTTGRFPQGAYGVYSGLLSPTATSPGADSSRDGVPPSMMSDSCSYYSTSPIIGGHPDSSVDLPPLRIGDSSPRMCEMSHMPSSKLPSLMRPDLGSEHCRLAPILDSPPNRQLMTAPNSPLASHTSSPKEDKDSRMKLDNLLS